MADMTTEAETRHSLNGKAVHGDGIPQPSITELISGIMTDAQTLFKQQIQMFRAEFKEDVRRTTNAAQYMGLGIGIAAIGALFIIFAAVHLLNWLTLIALWGCFAIVGGVLMFAGFLAFRAGRNAFQKFSPLPDKTIHALQENVSWITNPRN